MQLLTAADYVYIDRTTRIYNRAKAFIGETFRSVELASDRGARRRPGIPDTIETLNDRVRTLVETGEFETAAQLIETKVCKAYGLEHNPQNQNDNTNKDRDESGDH